MAAARFLTLLFTIFLTNRLTFGQPYLNRELLSVLSYEKLAVVNDKVEEGEEHISDKSDHQWKGHNKWNATKRRSNHGKIGGGSNSGSDTKSQVILFVHIAKTGGSSFDEILKKGVNNVHADCIVEKKHYEDKSIPLDKRYDFPNCHIISTEFSRHVVSKYLLPKTREGIRPQWSNAMALKHVKFMTLMREPFSRLLSQYRHDRFYTPRRFRDCPDLVSLVNHDSKCIQNGEPAYRYQNFQTMMLGGCTWNHKTSQCELAKLPVANGGGYVKPMDILAEFHFVGVNEHFEASVCLFYDTVGDHHQFRKFCQASSSRATPRMMQGSWIANKKGGESAALDATVLRAAVPTNELDFKLYWAAYDGFIQRARAVEARTGVTII